MSEFTVGQKVVCVDDDMHPEWQVNFGKELNMYGLKRGAVYEIRGFADCPDGTLGLRLREIVRRAPDVPFHHSRFKPLEFKAMEIFRRIAANPKIEIREPA